MTSTSLLDNLGLKCDVSQGMCAKCSVVQDGMLTLDCTCIGLPGLVVNAVCD